LRNLKTRFNFLHCFLLTNLILSFNTNVLASDKPVADSFLLYAHGNSVAIETSSKNRIKKSVFNTSHFSNFDRLNQLSISFFDKYAVKNHNVRFIDFNSIRITGSKLTFFPVDGVLNQDKLASKSLAPLLTVFKFEF
jgi:hypothetical protein